jgi:hypothetical protein
VLANHPELKNELEDIVAELGFAAERHGAYAVRSLSPNEDWSFYHQADGFGRQDGNSRQLYLKLNHTLIYYCLSWRWEEDGSTADEYVEKIYGIQGAELKYSTGLPTPLSYRVSMPRVFHLERSCEEITQKRLFRKDKVVTRESWLRREMPDRNRGEWIQALQDNMPLLGQWRDNVQALVNEHYSNTVLAQEENMARIRQNHADHQDYEQAYLDTLYGMDNSL